MRSPASTSRPPRARTPQKPVETTKRPLLDHTVQSSICCKYCKYHRIPRAFFVHVVARNTSTSWWYHSAWAYNDICHNPTVKLFKWVEGGQTPGATEGALKIINVLFKPYIRRTTPHSSIPLPLPLHPSLPLHPPLHPSSPGSTH